MYLPEFTNTLSEIIEGLFKHNYSRYEKIKKKMDQILLYPQHYKPLSYDLKGLRHVHIDVQFVLVFKIIEENKIVKFIDFDHHDKIYKKRFLE